MKYVVTMVACLLMGATVTANAEQPVDESGQFPAWEAGVNIAGLIAHVPRLKHPYPHGQDWQPTLMWWQVPLSFDDPAKLKQELAVMKSRGLLPSIEVPAEYGTPKAYPEIPQVVAQAKAVADAGFPVHLSMKGRLNLYAMPDGKIVQHVDTPDPDQKDAVGHVMPCLVIKDGWQARAKHIRGLMQAFADASVPVAGVWYDYEDHPHPWNGIFSHSRQCPSCRKQYPVGVLDSRKQFKAYVEKLRYQALAQALAQPVRDVFASARTGFYGYAPASAQYPVGTVTGHPIPETDVNPDQIDVAQPVCYAYTRHASRYFEGVEAIPSREIDRAYFVDMLAAVSNVTKNIRSDQFLVPFVSGLVCEPDDPTPRMTRSLYREFLRHAILRGARGFYCYNTAPPYSSVAEFYSELADINAVYNEMFAYPDFLQDGQTLNHDYPDFKTINKTDENSDKNKTNAIIWSGMRKGDKALVRVVTLQQSPHPVSITPFPGVTVRLIASPAGATYMINADGHVQAVD